MPARLIDSRAHAHAIQEELKRAVEHHSGQRRPGITVIQVGDDPASTTYVRGKNRAAEEVGFQSAIEHLHGVSQQEL
ncbi:MAG TPA: tetrahydrofolate dehydrogenase/cyclohydrolase catalytic domain-containing protein, partial [Candidatus Acidoferrum sp.]|nr:tetrahydrofolate dehydrogenase/cyclohydrolase catalytic domain-containing protein [Candidatus Acidoferrum sp.]